MLTPLLLKWYPDFCRHLPWRETKEAYPIWISEIILQQTRVIQGLPYYYRFLERFPDLYALAEATEDEVLKTWQGLGYYSRARHMHEAAKDIVNRFHGQFPSSAAQLEQIKGIGPYTAAAVASFAFDEVIPVLDGNVARVVSRYLGLYTPIDTTLGKKQIRDVLTEWIDPSHPALFNQAMMEFGALQCIPKAPQCEICVLKQECVAYRGDMVSQLPVKSHRTKVRDRYFYYLVMDDGHSVYLHQRQSRDIWKGLWEFPLIETDTEVALDVLMAQPSWKKWFTHDIPTVFEMTPVYNHVLTHQKLHARFLRLTIPQPISDTVDPSLVAVPKNEVGDYAVPKLLDQYLMDHPFQ